MSTGYVAVGWNRQKKIYDGFIFLFCLVYLGIFIVTTVVTNPDYSFETVLIRSTSTLAFLLLHIILAIGPLCRINRKFLPLLYNRRHLGVTMFSISLIHGLFSIIQFHALGNVQPLVSLFTSNTQFNSISQFPFQALGFFALVILLLMAVTSHDFWLHQLSPRIWKTLHMCVYLAYALIILHVLLGVIQYETHPAYIVLLSGGAITLVTLHLIAGWKEVKKDNEKFDIRESELPILEGYVKICRSTEFVEGKAKIFSVDKERIAVYLHENRLYAIHNVCKHQGGPLGEGKIIDGCITCPWHGYQYLPHNGQSPPPFHEKVNTYDLQVVGGDVWINPNPFDEGTEKPGVAII
jgi:methionine sulfoxide reductase heme-binding subunit